MDRLSLEWQRLYLPAEGAGPEAVRAPTSLFDAEGRVRALVLELARPASWELLGVVWRGVQHDLELPAPAIAVSGTDGLQLWFSLAEAVPALQARVFLAQLCARFLPGVAAQRLHLWPEAENQRHARPVPAEQGQTGNWSAFVAPDLAPVFADTPWLDIPPNPEGQAELLSRLGSIDQAAWAAALGRLRPVAATTGPSAREGASDQGSAAQAVPASLDPRRFLLQVMGDETVALALRIEAAKALLPYTEGRPGTPD